MDSLSPNAPQDNPLKRCPTCGNSFPATAEFFHRDTTKPDGLHVQCKTCKNAHTKVYASSPGAHERKLAWNAAYRERPEVHARRQAQDKERHQDKERRKAYLHRPEVQARYRAYRRHPKVRARVRTHSQNRRARKKDVLGTHTSEQIQEQLKRQKCRCYYCKAKFEQRYIYHVDHTFPLSRVAGTDIPANNISYIVLTCPTCNERKGDKFPHEFPEGGKLL